MRDSAKTVNVAAASKRRAWLATRDYYLLGHVFVLLLGVGLWSTQTWAKEAGAKKLIYYGWGVRDTQYVRDHWHQMEEMPFDGMGIVVAVDRQAWQQGGNTTGNQLGWQVMGRRSFRVEEFHEAIADLKAASWHTFTDNFLPVALSAAQSADGLNWFDEQRWPIVVNNFAVLARVAAEGGAKGLILDPERYSYGLFSYLGQRQQVDKPFGRYVQMARRRGRQVMTAIAAHLPEAVLLSLFGYTLPLRELQRGKTLREADYGLLPAFYDGLLDAMPAGACLIDGYELAYPFKERRQFLDGYGRIHQGAVALSAVPDRYREKVKAGFGLWLDYRKQPDYFTAEEFQRAVSNALEVSDGYVWVYTERPRFFPPSGIAASYIEAIAGARRIFTLEGHD